MAITVSAEFKAIWQEKQGKAIHQRLRYKRRYKLAGSYFTESNWNVLERDEFCSIGSIPQQGDVRLNVIKTSVLTLKLPNENNQFIEHAASPSFWAADAVATDGYKSTRTEWQVQEGYMLASGTIEWISVFTGIQLKPAKITGKGEYALIEVSSKAILLEKADAEEVCEEPGLENCIPATGDGTNVAFESTSTGVDHAKLFEVNGVNLTQGSAWRVSNDNQIDSAGNTGRLAITADVAPGNLQTVKTSVKRWLKDKLVEYLEGLLADEAGITSAMRTIAAVVFPGGLSGSKTIDTQANWEAGTVLTNTDTADSPGDLKQKWFLVDNFSDLDYTASPAWSVAAYGTSSSAATGALVLTASATEKRTMSLPLSKQTGTWRFRAKSTTADSLIIFAQNGNADENGPLSTGIGIRLRTSAGNEVNFGTFSGTGASVQRTDSGTDTTIYHEYRITRNDAGYAELFIDGVSVGGSVLFSETMGLAMVLCAGFNGTLEIDDIYYSHVIDGSGAVSTASMVWESAVQDILSTPTAWGTLDKVEALNGGTIAYATASSTDGVSFDAYVAISGIGVISSALKRYFKIRVIMTPASESYTTPTVSSLVANFSVSTINVSLANHRGRTVMEQMELYVKLADYELRFSGDGTMVIGPKTAGSYVVHLTQENGIIDVTEVDYGIPDRVIRGARVRYQGFVSVYGDAEASASAETIADGDELGKAIIDEDLDQMLVANDLNLGDSRARVLYDNNRRSATDPRPPIRLRLKIWDVPWLEVGDVVRVSYYDHPILGVLQANDELLKADSPYFHMGAPGNVISAAKDWRVLYYNPNKDIGQADILCEEVL